MIFKAGDTFQQQYTVNERIYLGFIRLFNDNHPLHTNVSFAKEKGFHDKIMHGAILNGFLSHFIGECLPTKSLVIHSIDIQFKNAVYLNDTLEFTAIVDNVYETVNAVEFKYQFKNAATKTLAKGKFQIGLLA